MAKGVGRARILFVHALRNAVLPILTLAGVQVGQLLSGAIIIETIFGEFSYSDFKMELTETHPTLEYCTQYHETTFDFISRLIEREGIHYYFRHNENDDTNLLGMNLLSSLQGWRVEGTYLVLQP